MKIKQLRRRLIWKHPKLFLFMWEHKLWYWLTERKIKEDGVDDVNEWVEDINLLKNIKPK